MTLLRQSVIVLLVHFPKYSIRHKVNRLLGPSLLGHSFLEEWRMWYPVHFKSFENCTTFPVYCTLLILTLRLMSYIVITSFVVHICCVLSKDRNVLW